jgi:hypothetical protein
MVGTLNVKKSDKTKMLLVGNVLEIHGRLIAATTATHRPHPHH